MTLGSSASIHSHRTIDGVKTEVLLQPFADSILVLVTQLGKVGNLIQATIPTTSRSNITTDETISTSEGQYDMPTPPASIELSPLLGSPPSDYLATLHSLYASQIATIVWRHADGTIGLNNIQPSRKVVVGIALKSQTEADRRGSLPDSSRSTFLGVMRMITDLLKPDVQSGSRRSVQV